MTVSSAETVRHVAAGNGIWSTLQTAIRAVDPTHVRVIYTPTVGDPYELTQGSDYTPSLVNGQVQIALTFVPPSGSTITVERATPRTQDLQLSTVRKLPSEAIETALDKLTFMAAEAVGGLDTAPALPASASFRPTLPMPEADKVLRGKSDGSGWEHAAISDLPLSNVTLPLSITQGGTGADSKAQAKYNLGIGPDSITWEPVQYFDGGLRVRNSDGAGAELWLHQLGDYDDLGRLKFRGLDSQGSEINYAYLKGGRHNSTAGASSGALSVYVQRGGTVRKAAEFANGLSLVDGTTAGTAGQLIADTVEAQTAVDAPIYRVSGSPAAGLRRTVIDLGTLDGVMSTAPHNLGVNPEEVFFYLECVTADGEFQVGDRVPLAAVEDGGTFRTVTGYWNATTVGWGRNGSTIQIASKTGAQFALTLANWAVKAVLRW